MHTIDIDSLKEVTSGILFTDKGMTKPHPDGLLSEQIFGPVNNYRCSCGKLIGQVLYKDQVCEDCGVECTSSEVRYKRFGKIKLLFPIVRKRDIEHILKHLKKKNKYILDPLVVDLTTSTHIYIKYNANSDTFIVENQYTSTCLPLPITGIFSLYINIYTLKHYYNSALAAQLLNYFTDDLLVVPPNCRLSLVTDDKGNKKLFKSELDDLYINILNIQGYNKTNYGEQVDINQYYEMVKISLDNDMITPIIDEQIKFLDGIASYFQFYNNKIHEKVSSVLSGKGGLIRRDQVIVTL
jgi:hypothetical protein